MYRIDGKVGALDSEELTKAAKKHLLPYQIHYLDRLTSGVDHWAWNVGRGAGRKDFIARQLTRKPPPPEVVGKLLGDETGGKSVKAFILDGRWVARCECNGQEVVDPTDPVFVCLNRSCLNASSKNMPRSIDFPSNVQLKRIARILLGRINPVNRNWDRLGLLNEQRKPETIDDLAAENKKRKVKLAKVKEL